MTGTTFISFTSCRLEGGWKKVGDDIENNIQIFSAIKSDAKIHVRNSIGMKKQYFMKEGATIKIRNNIIEFTRAEFQNPDYKDA